MKRLVFALSCSLLVLPLWAQGTLGSGLNEAPPIGTPIPPSGSGNAGTGAAPSGPAGGTPDSLFPSIDTTPLDTRSDDISTPEAQESFPDRGNSFEGTGGGTGIGTGETNFGTETEVPTTTP